MTDTVHPYELTRNPVDETWGFICREHGVHRSGLAERHARNVEAKHVREDHGDPTVFTVDLKPLAAMAVHAAIVLGNHPEAGGPARAAEANARLEMWAKLVGMEEDLEKAVALAALVNQQDSVTAAVVPF